ncbi:MAG: rod shape-determining protein MreD [Sphingomonadaceae bacterium]|nr:rod shape-determining protein MreD [Sphingomonadaceae bacterium]
MARGYAPRLNKGEQHWAVLAIPALSVLLGSLTSVLPHVTLYPLLPPFGFLLLLGWRLLVRDIWSAWAALPLGFFDDLLSGQPLGSSMLLWTLALLALGLCDRWIMWRDYRQDWVIASLLIILALLGGLAVANMSGGQTSALYIIPQIIVSLLFFPLIVRICGGLDQLRWSL